MDAINWDAVEDNLDEIEEIFAKAEDEQAHHENDPEYLALYFPPEEE